jgi:hypothetical protein
MMAPAGEPVIAVDVEDYTWKDADGEEAWIVDQPAVD